MIRLKWGHITHPLGKGGFKHRNHILSLNTCNVEAFSPTLKNTMVYVVLSCGVGKGKTEIELLEILVRVMRFDELLKTVGNVFPELIRIAGLKLLWHSVFGLNDIELGFFLGKNNLANSQVGSTHIQGEECTSLVTCGKGHAPSRVHWLI
jgi:hypothetical protein